MQINVDFLCKDSILAVPLLLALSLFSDLAMRAGKSRIQTWLSFYLKSTMHDEEHEHVHDLFQQYTMLKNVIREMGGYETDVKLVFWQLCPDIRVDGIHDDVDINVFNGYHDRLEKFLKEERIK